MKKFLSLLFVVLFLGGYNIHARSNRVNDYINERVELILTKTLYNPSVYVEEKSQFMQLVNQKEQPNSSVNNAFFSLYIDHNIHNFRAGDWKRYEVDDLENYFQNIFPARFEWIDRVASLRANKFVALTEDDIKRCEELLRDLLVETNEIEIPGYAFMGETGDDGKLIYWATSNYSPSGKTSEDIKPSSTTVKKDGVEYTIKQRIYYSLNETDEFSHPSEITPSKFTCNIEGNEYTFSPRLPSVDEVIKFVKTCTPSHHITHERWIYLNEVNMDKIFVSSENNILEFITGAYWTSSPEWAYEFSVPGLDISTGEIPIKATMINIEEYNSNRKAQGKSTVSPMARLVISVDEKLIDSVRAHKIKGIEEELNQILSKYESPLFVINEIAQETATLIEPICAEMVKLVNELEPFDYKITETRTVYKTHGNEYVKDKKYKVDVTLNKNARIIEQKLVQKFGEEEYSKLKKLYISYLQKAEEDAVNEYRQASNSDADMLHNCDSIMIQSSVVEIFEQTANSIMEKALNITVKFDGESYPLKLSNGSYGDSPLPGDYYTLLPNYMIASHTMRHKYNKVTNRIFNPFLSYDLNKKDLSKISVYNVYFAKGGGLSTTVSAYESSTNKAIKVKTETTVEK